MWFSVFKADGDLLYEGYSWLMARAALDFAVMQDNRGLLHPLVNSRFCVTTCPTR